MNMVTQQLAAGGPEAVAASKDLRAALVAAKVQLAGSKGFVGRFFSIKAAHGIIMFVSWINIAGACSGCSAALQSDKIARGLQRGQDCLGAVGRCWCDCAGKLHCRNQCHRLRLWVWL
jgi:hypothetical protein